MKNLRFVREGDLWYIDLPEWQGDKADLLMVAGADTLLDRVAYEKDSVELLVVEAPIDDFYKLTLLEQPELAGGGTYRVSGPDTFPPLIWLCNVTKYVFGGYMPREIYFKPTFLL